MNTHIREISLGAGRVLKATPVLDTYWRFAQVRQSIFHSRVLGEAPPWTDDPILAEHRFTNAYRAADRVSQFLIRDVIYSGLDAPEEVFFRTLFFKIFNRIETWNSVRNVVEQITWNDFDFERYAQTLDAIRANGTSIYSNAYIMPSPPFGEHRKHRNHLRLLERMMRDRLPERIADASSLEAVFLALQQCPSFGRFLAFQFAIDLNYSTICDHSEMDFVVAGPGASDGIRKCFVDTAGLTDEEVIRVVTERASEEFARLDIEFDDLWGRPLQLIDCQNLFCEVGKYARVVHPEYQSVSGRTRIKQRFSPLSKTLPQWYPPKWGIEPPITPAATESSSCAMGGEPPFELEIFAGTRRISNHSREATAITQS